VAEGDEQAQHEARGEAQDQARDFEAQRRYLGAVAYRMLGSLADAEDVLQ
jgi:RNA polymerase sigma-70 factor, ECF subfamily